MVIRFFINLWYKIKSLNCLIYNKKIHFNQFKILLKILKEISIFKCYIRSVRKKTNIKLNLLTWISLHLITCRSKYLLTRFLQLVDQTIILCQLLIDKLKQNVWIIHKVSNLIRNVFQKFSLKQKFKRIKCCNLYQS